MLINELSVLNLKAKNGEHMKTQLLKTMELNRCLILLSSVCLVLTGEYNMDLSNNEIHVITFNLDNCIHTAFAP